MSPRDLASAVDKSIVSLQNTKGEIKVYLKTNDGDGTYDEELRVVDRKKYSVPSPSPACFRNVGPASEFVVFTSGPRLTGVSQPRSFGSRRET